MISSIYQTLKLLQTSDDKLCFTVLLDAHAMIATKYWRVRRDPRSVAGWLDPACPLMHVCFPSLVLSWSFCAEGDTWLQREVCQPCRRLLMDWKRFRFGGMFNSIILIHARDGHYINHPISGPSRKVWLPAITMSIAVWSQTFYI